jgi:hypothetical protein
MGYVWNPLTGNLDIAGAGSGGGGSGPAERYTSTFNNTTDWTLNSPDYTRTILAATHGRGTSPNVQVFELISGSYEQINVNVVVNGSGDVTLKVTETPNNRFTGLVLII